MKNHARWSAPFVVAVALLSSPLHAASDNDPWDSYRFLLGEWTGEGSGQPGQGKGEFTFAPELDGKVLVRRNVNQIPTGPDRPPTVHEDLMVVYPAEKGQPLRAIYFDNEGHVISYTVHPSDDRRSLTFLSDPESVGAPLPPDLYAEN